jgi:hypothetical protein
MIPTLHPITVMPKPLNARLYELCGKEAGGKLTPLEAVELDALFRVIEAEQDTQP